MHQGILLASLCCLLGGSNAIAPKFSWDTVANMTFFHACNESGLFNDAALRTITKFPLVTRLRIFWHCRENMQNAYALVFEQVTIEKGQGYNDGTHNFAEQKITAQCAAVKAIDPSICTVFYMNSVLSWYFYQMNGIYEKHPEQWLYDSTTGEPVKGPGDRHFDPPKGGMLIFNHANEAMRTFWKGVCLNATASGVVGTNTKCSCSCSAGITNPNACCALKLQQMGASLTLPRTPPTRRHSTLTAP